jgi:hypothetical protein
MEIAGGCLCRAVRYRITALPVLTRVATIWTSQPPSWACINPDLPRVAAQPSPRSILRCVFKTVLDEHMHVDANTLAKRVFPDSSGARPLSGLIRA